MRKLIFGRKYGEIANWAINTSLGTTWRSLSFSTRSGNLIVNWGDGLSNSYTVVKNLDCTTISNASMGGTEISHTYSSFVGNALLNFSNGINDVYSINIGNGNFLLGSDWSTFINQFTNLYSINIDTPHNVCYINGDASQIPNSVEKFYIRDFRNSGSFYMNVSNFSNLSQLKEFKSIDGLYGVHNTFNNIYGDLSKLPPLIQIFTLRDNLDNTFTYTSGRTWASSFDTLNLGNAKLSITDTDNLLIDMANSITTAIGSKVINLANCIRSSVSDTAVAYLRSLGFTITVLVAYIIRNIRYIKEVLNGSTANSSNHWVEIQAFVGSTNLALGKNSAIYNGSTNKFIANTALITDGNTSSGSYYDAGSGQKYALIDLGAIYLIERINIRHYYADGRKYNTKLLVSENGVDWYTVYDSSISGTYAENSNGKNYISF